MKCPICTTVDLVRSERQGAEVYTASQATPAVAPSPQQQGAPLSPQPAQYYANPGKGHYNNHHDQHGLGKHGKRSFRMDSCSLLPTFFCLAWYRQEFARATSRKRHASRLEVDNLTIVYC